MGDGTKTPSGTGLGGQGLLLELLLFFRVLDEREVGNGVGLDEFDLIHQLV